jgi:hypothetical protein
MDVVRKVSDDYIERIVWREELRIMAGMLQLKV